MNEIKWHKWNELHVQENVIWINLTSWREFDDMGDINDMVKIWQYGWNQQCK